VASRISHRFGLALGAVLLLASCAEPPVRSQVTQEIHRICALPANDRQAEIDKVRASSGLVIVCPGAPEVPVTSEVPGSP